MDYWPEYPMPPRVKGERFGVWADFLTYLWRCRHWVTIRRGKRCRMYSWTNCHYIVTGGRVITRFGYHGFSLFNAIERGDYGEDVVASLKAEFEAIVAIANRECDERMAQRDAAEAARRERGEA